MIRVVVDLVDVAAVLFALSAFPLLHRSTASRRRPPPTTHHYQPPCERRHGRDPRIPFPISSRSRPIRLTGVPRRAPAHRKVDACICNPHLEPI
ncbi:hypothetical protein GUJ93_ZPchr0012g19498 [Zizania palustris]|uniref:Uncharacterized protein n=1 Tax=Zizania palustris TaxID=103762 RepID=A0A8J5WPJ7_ZIZPA|nr:hypothetical protein GUJ93_ZPchr0012g19498 [Zizania palustris]